MNNIIKNLGHQIIVVLVVMCTTMTSQSATLISGNVSGSWPASGNPYLITDTTTVPVGQTLNIDPNVTIILGSNIQFIVQGRILAVGTRDQPIVFRGATPSNYWQSIFINWNSDLKSRFVFCKISDAKTGLDLKIQTISGIKNMEIDVLDSTFSNIQMSCIYGEAIGMYDWVGGPSGGNSFGFPKIKASIHGCLFSNAARGCYFVSNGARYSYPYGHRDALGSVEATIANCRFENMTDRVIALDQSAYSDYGYVSIYNNMLLGSNNGIVLARTAASVRNVYPTILNNVFASNAVAVSVSDFADATIRNNIFVGNSNAVVRAGTLASKVEYNCFHNNQTSFNGYPAAYGQVIWQNQNGTPSDLACNIFQDPAFVAVNDYHLKSGSACIDAGIPDADSIDMCFPPSQGSNCVDVGIYGGPYAANWLDTVPLLAMRTSIGKDTNGVISVQWNAVPRSEYQVQWTSNALSVLTTNWINVSNGWVRANAIRTTVNVDTNSSCAERFFRVQVLGRTPGY